MHVCMQAAKGECAAMAVPVQAQAGLEMTVKLAAASGALLPAWATSPAYETACAWLADTSKKTNNNSHIGHHARPTAPLRTGAILSPVGLLLVLP